MHSGGGANNFNFNHLSFDSLGLSGLGWIYTDVEML